MYFEILCSLPCLFQGESSSLCRQKAAELIPGVRLCLVIDSFFYSWAGGNANVYLVAVGLGARLGRAGSIAQAVVVGVGTCRGSQVIFAARGGTIIPAGTQRLQQCVRLRMQLCRNVMSAVT